MFHSFLILPWASNETLECIFVQLLSTCRRRELECSSVRLGIGFPVAYQERVFRRLPHRLAGDYIFARNRVRAGLDPQLPVDVRVAKHKMLALDTSDDADAQVLRLNH